MRSRNGGSWIEEKLPILSVEGMMDVNPSGVKNAHAMDEVIFHSFASDMVAE